MKAVLVDDEPLARKELRRLLNAHPTVEVVGEAGNAKEALKLITSQRPDLVFLDVQMPGQSGFDLLARLESPPEIIFTTAYDQFALRAFEFGACDYLLKPVIPERLAVSLSRVHADKVRASYESNVREGERLTGADQVLVRDGDSCWMVAISEIHLLESEGNYTRVFFRDKKALIPRSLTVLEDKLDPRLFFRANRQHIINLKHIENIQPWFSRSLRVTLRSGQAIEMSRRRSQDLKDLTSF
jgi:two-component system, LytTR family, response regulator